MGEAKRLRDADRDLSTRVIRDVLRRAAELRAGDKAAVHGITIERLADGSLRWSKAPPSEPASRKEAAE